MFAHYVTDLYYSANLRNLGYPQDNHTFYWIKCKSSEYKLEFRPNLDANLKEYFSAVAAPFGEQLARYLPLNVCLGDGRTAWRYITSDGYLFRVKYLDEFRGDTPFITKLDTFSNCVAHMAITLINQGYIKGFQ